MLHKYDFDSLACVIGGTFVWFGAYLSSVFPVNFSVEAVVEAEQQSILELHFQITETLYITPADCLQLFGGCVGVWGVCSMIYKRALKWYNSKSK